MMPSASSTSSAVSSSLALAASIMPHSAAVLSSSPAAAAASYLMTSQAAGPHHHATAKQQHTTKASSSGTAQPTASKAKSSRALPQLAKDYMNEIFNSGKYFLTPEERAEVARKGGITEEQVTTWFANKRSRTNNTRPSERTAAATAKEPTSAAPRGHQLLAPSAQAHAHAQMLAAAQITQAQSQQLAQVHAARGLQHPVALQPQAMIPMQPLSEAELKLFGNLSQLSQFRPLTHAEMAELQLLQFRYQSLRR